MEFGDAEVGGGFDVVVLGGGAIVLTAMVVLDPSSQVNVEEPSEPTEVPTPAVQSLLQEHAIVAGITSPALSVTAAWLDRAQLVMGGATVLTAMVVVVPTSHVSVEKPSDPTLVPTPAVHPSLQEQIFVAE